MNKRLSGHRRRLEFRYSDTIAAAESWGSSAAAPLRRIEFILALLAPRTFPVIGQVLKGCAVVLIGVVDISAYGADVFTRSLLLGEVHLCINGGHRVIQIYNSLCFKVFIALGSMCAAVDCRVVTDKFSYSVKGFAGGVLIIKYYGQLVLIKRLINVGYIAVEHIEKPVILNNDNAVAVGVTFSFDEINALGYFLAFGEVVVSAVGEIHGNEIVNALQLRGIQLIAVDVYLRVGELCDTA